MKRKHFLLLLFAATIASIVILWFFSRTPKAVYSYLEVAYNDITATLTVSGRIVPDKELNVTPRIAADVSEILVESGEKVRQGQVLMTLKAIPDISLLEEADSRVELMKIALEQAETDFERAKQLYSGKSISTKEYEVSKNALLTAKENYTLALNKRNIIAKGNSGRSPENDVSIVTSPINGIISEILVSKGETVSPGVVSPGTVLCRITDSGALLFKGNVDEMDIASIREGMPAKLMLGALPDDTISANITTISSFGRTNNGYTQFEIKAALTHIPDGVQLRSGYSANAEIVTDQVKHTLSLPEECIRFDEQLKPYVLRLISDPDDIRHQEWEIVPVRLGISDNNLIQVLSGLNEHDLIQSKTTTVL